MTHFGSSYGTPGWQRAQARGRGGFGGGFGDKGGFSEDADEYAARDDGMDDVGFTPPERGRARETGVRSAAGPEASCCPGYIVMICLKAATVLTSGLGGGPLRLTIYRNRVLDPFYFPSILE